MDFLTVELRRTLTDSGSTIVRQKEATMGGMSSSLSWREPWGPAAEVAVTEALSHIGVAIAELPSQDWDPASSTIGGVRDYRCSYLGNGGPTWSFLLLQADAMFYEELAAALSLRQPDPVVVFTEFDQSVWAYSLWQSGKELDRFWSDAEHIG